MPDFVAQEFGTEITRLTNLYLDKIDRLHRDSVKDVFRRVINRTPIDYERSDPKTVGRARANWILTRRSPSERLLTDNDEEGGRAPLLMYRGPTVEKMESAVESSSIFTRNFYLTNNVHYIIRLEYLRTSKQAPYGMRDITLTEFLTLVEMNRRIQLARRR